MFLVLHARDLGMVMKWKPYKLRVCKIFTDGKTGHFQYAYPAKEHEPVPKNHMFELDSRMELELTCGEHDDPEVTFADQVLTVKAKRMDNIDSMFRCIGTPDNIKRLIIALNAASGNKAKRSEVSRQCIYCRGLLNELHSVPM